MTLLKFLNVVMLAEMTFPSPVGRLDVSNIVLLADLTSPSPVGRLDAS